MKRFSIFIFLLASISSFGQELKIPQYVQNYLEANKLERADVYKVLNPNESKFIKNDSTKSISDKESMFFIDETPEANWDHPCRYVIWDFDGKIISVFYDSEFPYECKMYCINRRYLEYEEQDHNTIIPNQYQREHIRSNGSSEHKYAVIIESVNIKSTNDKRFWNDCSEIYSTLVYNYGFDENNIYVIMSDGTNSGDDRCLARTHCPWYNLFSDPEDCWEYDSSPLDLDGDGDNDIQYPMTRNSLITVFNNLADILSEEDNLFVFVTGHGEIVGGLPLWQQESDFISKTEFASYLNLVNAGTITVVMENCFSGLFIPFLSAPNRVIITACANTQSWTKEKNRFNYNEFVHHWTAAMAGGYPAGNHVNADSDNDGHVSMQEAFFYAKINDCHYIEGDEEPQYYSNSTLLGNSLDLDGVFCYTKNLHNTTFNIDTTFRSCKLNLDDDVVKTGKNVTFEFIEDVNIHPLTHFEQGSTVHIKPVSSILLEYSPDLLFSMGEDVVPETYSEIELKDFDVLGKEKCSMEYSGEKIQMKLYPNPTKSTIFVQSDSIHQIEIFDIVGVKMSCTTEKNDLFWELDVSDLPEGQYFLKIRTVSGNSISKTFIKQ
ncbi:MAG: T9SS type A sorting domain-containing protein [Bacteroidales bacterium]|nr:T9SS type A sorting domain-containing protein [Bacteroidales bacterium]